MNVSEIKSSTHSKPIPGAVVFLVIVVFDQVTKFVTRAKLDIGEIWPDWPVRFTHVKNSGSAFGLLDGQTTFLIVSSMIAIAVMIYFYRQLAESSLSIRIALGMMLGGAISNLADRIRDGNVTDMIEFPHYPVFNVADSSVVIGIGIIMITALFQPKSRIMNSQTEKPEGRIPEGPG